MFDATPEGHVAGSPFKDHPQPPAGMRDEVLAGLLATPKTLPAKYFYDERGSRLFERICRLPEYYPTVTETAILSDRRAEIADTLGSRAAIVEYGSGSSEKIRILLDALKDPVAYVPVDISHRHLVQSAARLAKAYPGLPIHPLAADFTQAFSLPDLPGRPVGFFPGSTIGNFTPGQAAAFLKTAGRTLGAGSTFVVGFDLVKDRAMLEAAYNDSQGVTAAFNLNALAHLNRELGCDFPLDAFAHFARFNPGESRIEMHLKARFPLTVRVAGAAVRFRAGETIHTENSYKYSPARIKTLAAGAGWTVRRLWTDARQWFAVAALSR
jgi:dimethylhistidine N-methyltransferase